MINVNCSQCGNIFEAINAKAKYCSDACKLKAWRSDKQALKVDPTKDRLDAMAAYLKQEIGGLKNQIISMETRLIEMSNKYASISSYIYKSMAELRKHADPEGQTIEYDK